ncbi:MAG: gamma-glutamyl-gamma-aminobutyrate hydrolase family protein [Candidatus Pacearchaeota archaeon]|nr:gamma-glutamyl-gamma-aminobutyrate hydrolase family protein [Candidatus Pacearchaeota archaeon]
MNIAISQRVIKPEKGEDRDCLEQDYVKYYSNHGFTLIPISNVIEDMEGHLKKLNIRGVILSGGNDVNPKVYGEKEAGEYSNERDFTERRLIDFVIKNKLPLLGECRGMQFINVYFGGKLRKIEGHVAKRHKIFICNPEFKENLGKEETFVNSFHNKGILKEDLSKELVAFAISQDKSIEGFFHPRHNIMGIMWHPERGGCEESINQMIINRFLKNLNPRHSTP